ncbi:hypothetical protein AJ80_09952 [Polytolypa hystricis UAMH7299]|uniref:Uncharacterized protein n=1 Tax=Polytolypa hystricis (strain UAMH7299) TaxID=1447883 RepID=A0A2B7WFS5_POLH7|nr:hypothetical protein AJ80_09952 [Polytolypa hystricis UAMH7299]
MPTRGNINRGARRQECRQALSKHIEKVLGITVSPEEVRLKPEPHDPYQWIVKKTGKEALFATLLQKHLSLHSTRTFELLRKGVGTYFYAAPADFEPTLDKGHSSGQQPVGDSRDDIPMQADIQYWKDAAQKAEQDNCQLRRDLERAKKCNNDLEILVRACYGKVELMESCIRSHFGEILKVIGTEQMELCPPNFPADLVTKSCILPDNLSTPH